MNHLVTPTNTSPLSSDSGEMTPKVSAPKSELEDACSMQTQKKSRYIPELDGIRTVAIFSVLMHHGFSNRCPGGFLGVDLFFVLSGYLITRLLVVEFETNHTIDLVSFYIRRACRLMPAIFTTIIFAILLRKITTNNPNTISDFQCAKSILLYYSNFLYGTIGNLNHTWSLSIEQQFYLIWPLILLISFRLISLSALLTTISLTIMGCVALRCELMLEHFQGFSLYTFTPTRIDTILVGTLLGLTSELPRSKAIINFLKKIYAPEVVMAMFFIFIFTARSDDSWLYFGGLTIVAILFAIPVACYSKNQSDTPLARALRNPLSCWIGKRSYGIYLYHYPIYLAVDGVFQFSRGAGSLVSIFLIKIPITFAVAAFSYRFIESPFLKMKSRPHPPSNPPHS